MSKDKDQKTMMRKHTLEKIADDLGNNFDEEKLHAAMLLSFSEALFGTVSRDCAPMPVYRIVYDDRNHNISVEENGGYELPYVEKGLDVSVMKTHLCCNLRSIPLLLEGDTGVGKTYNAMKYLSTIFSKEQFFSHRLSANAFMNNLFSHFQEGKIVNGMPTIEARIDRIESTGAGSIDEINRGETNETLQMFDNEMHVGGVIYQLGVPIPELVNGKYNQRSGKKKRLILICAQNPSGAEDAKFTQTMQLDAAVDNRLLKTFVGNSAASAGTTLWLSEKREKRHDVFFDMFKNNLSGYLGVKQSTLSDLAEDWLPTYAWITDSTRTDKPILYSALELADMIISIFSGNLIEYYNYEKRVIEGWEKRLGKGAKIKHDLQETDEIKRIHEITQSFKVPIIFRDIDQIKKVSDVLATLRNIEDALNTSDPLKSYLETQRYVTARDVVSAAALVGRNKQPRSAKSPVNAINEVLSQYVALLQDHMQGTGYLPAQFDLFDPYAGVQQISVQKAFRETIRLSHGIDFLTDQLVNQASELTKKIAVSTGIKNVMIIRMVGNLMTLCGFLQQYKAEIEPNLKSYGKKTPADKAVDDLSSFYYGKLDKTAMIMPGIYQHRIQRTLGI